MKAKLLVLLTAMIVAVTLNVGTSTIYAANEDYTGNGDLTEGLTFTERLISNNSFVVNATDRTDNNTSTGGSVSELRYGQLTFATPKTITHIRVRSVTTAGQTVKWRFRDSTTALILENYVPATHDSTDTLVELENPLYDVQYVEYYNGATNRDLKEVALYDMTPPDTTAPAVPTGLTATPGNGNVSLSWDAVTDTDLDLDGYNVYIDNVKVNPSPLEFTNYSGPVTNNVSHTYQVTAVDNSGNESQKSDSVSTIYDTISPIAPIGLTSTPDGDGGTLLDWTDNEESDLAGYNVYVNDVKDNGSLVAPSEYAITGLFPNTLFSFTITAVDDSDNESPPSAAVTYFIDSAPPDTPTGLTATAGVGEVDLAWNANEDLDLAGYNLYRNGSKINGALLTGTTYTDTGLNNGTLYSYKLTAVDTSNNESAQTAAATATPIEPTTPTPGGVQTVATTEDVTVTWNAVPDADEYRIYRDGVQIGTAAASPFLDEGLPPDIVYNYQVSAVVDGEESLLSFPPSKARPGDSIRLPSNGGSVGTLDVIETAFSFLQKFWVYIVVVLAVLFGPTIIGFIFWMMRGFPKLEKQPARKKRAGQGKAAAKEKKAKGSKGGYGANAIDRRYDRLMREGRKEEAKALTERIGEQMRKQSREARELREWQERTGKRNPEHSKDLVQRHREERRELEKEIIATNRQERESRAANNSGSSGRAQRGGRSARNGR